MEAAEASADQVHLVVMDFDSIFRVTRAVLDSGSAEGVKQAVAPPSDGDVSADVDTILAATEKILAISHGVAEPDERDSLAFRRVLSPDRLMAERIDLDADKLRRTLLRRLARQRSLKAMPVAVFDPYTEGLVVSHPLSTPLEEINPLQLIEQARRITAMGPGGLASAEQITPEAQNIHPSTFGFISAIEGPESERIGVDTRMAWGAKLGSDGRLYQRFMNRRSGAPEWVSADRLQGKVVGLPD